mgnify:CR=1 FL=1
MLNVPIPEALLGDLPVPMVGRGAAYTDIDGDGVYLRDITRLDVDAVVAEIVAAYDATRYFFTPKKMGAQTAEANLNAGVAAAKQIINFLEKGDTTYKVN